MVYQESQKEQHEVGDGVTKRADGDPFIVFREHRDRPENKYGSKGERG